MLKLMGSLCVLTGGGMVWQRQHMERRRRRALLVDLLDALRRMAEEIRATRSPLPQLLERVAQDRGAETAELFLVTADAIRQGEDPTDAWQQGVELLPLEAREQEVLHRLDLRGEEEYLCKGISLAISDLTRCLEETERQTPDQEKRAAALCFSGAALLVILLL